MSVTYKAHVPTVQYGFVEVSADTFPEFVEAVETAAEEIARLSGQPVGVGGAEAQDHVSYSQAVQNVQQGLNGQVAPGLAGTPAGGSAGLPVAGAPAAPAAPAPQQQGGNYDGVQIATDFATGGVITYHSDGKYGPYFKVGDLRANVAKWDLGKPVTPEMAAKAIANRREYLASQGQ